MKTMIARPSISLCFALLLAGFTSQAVAETFTVKMISNDPAAPEKSMYFSPPLLHVQSGDTVVFEPTQVGHNTASKRGMIPEGAESWNGPMEEKFEVVFNTDGTYGYICSPHYSVGMVGLILVGDYTVNLDEARKVRHRGKAKAVFRDLFDQVDALSVVTNIKQ